MKEKEGENDGQYRKLQTDKQLLKNSHLQNQGTAAERHTNGQSTKGWSAKVQQTATEGRTAPEDRQLQ